MSNINIVKTSPIKPSFRVAKIQGMFDMPATQQSTFNINIDLDLTQQPWSIGLITGASGTGKTTIAKHLWNNVEVSNHVHQWQNSIVDNFPPTMTPTDITNLLSSVGLASPPAWLRPYNALSTGQQFRADLALAISKPTNQIIFDEFTSTVDRTVAKAVSVAIHKHIKRNPSKQFVAVTCHKDIIEWLQPDWVLDTDTLEVTWGCNRRPDIKIFIDEGTRETWKVFRGNHYLTGQLNGSARVFLAHVQLGDDPIRLAGFFSILPLMGKTGWWRGHRTVVLPDFQGMGIGNTLIETVAENLWIHERKRFSATTSAPGLVQHRLRHPEQWTMTRKPGMTGAPGKTAKNRTVSVGRLSTSWVYRPKELRP